MTTSIVPPDLAASALLDVNDVAALIRCSARHVFRMSGAGQLPKPVRIGRLVRWRRADLDTWLVGQSGKGDAVTPTNATAV